VIVIRGAFAIIYTKKNSYVSFVIEKSSLIEDIVFAQIRD